MNREFVTEFIEEYRRHPALWKIKSREYVNRNLKNVGFTALMGVCKKFKIGYSRDLIKKKIQSLRSTFRKEHKKVESSRRGGSEDIYVPNLWYFEMMMFIKDQEEPSQSITNPSNIVKEEVDDEDDDVEIEDTQIMGLEEITESQVSSPSTSTINTYYNTERQLKKRQRSEDSNEHTNFLQAYTNAMRNDVSDGSDAFGIYVGKKLKSIQSEHQKMYAETLITQVLQRSIMGNLSDTTVLFNQPRSSNPISPWTNMTAADNKIDNPSASCSSNEPPNK